MEIGSGQGIVAIDIQRLCPVANVSGINKPFRFGDVARSSEDIVSMNLRYKNPNHLLLTPNVPSICYTEHTLACAQEQPSASMDLIVSQHTFHYLPFEEVRQYVIEIVRLLKPTHGLACISLPRQLKSKELANTTKAAEKGVLLTHVAVDVGDHAIGVALFAKPLPASENWGHTSLQSRRLGDDSVDVMSLIIVRGAELVKILRAEVESAQRMLNSDIDGIGWTESIRTWKETHWMELANAAVYAATSPPRPPVRH